MADPKKRPKQEPKALKTPTEMADAKRKRENALKNKALLDMKLGREM